MTKTAEQAPCAVQAKIWRECLKQFDYGPDREQGACEKERSVYYSCMRDWKKRTTGAEYDYHEYEIVKECAPETSELHQCMMINMFEITRCQDKMNLLKKCAAKHDKLIRKALADDPATVNKITNSWMKNATDSLQWLWLKTIGRA